jgi:hypothetical protein
LEPADAREGRAPPTVRLNAKRRGRVASAYKKSVPTDKSGRPGGRFSRIAHGVNGREDFQPAPFVPFRNSEGVMPVCFLKAVLKEDLELKPTSSAMASSE